MRIAIGLPSYREAASIAHVTSEVDAGLLRIAEPADCIIINADGESPDATARLFLETPTRCRKQSLITTPHRGKGSNMVNILRYCREHEIAALAFIDTDIRSITPDWVEALLNPVLQGEADYVAPLYLRRRFEGATINTKNRREKRLPSRSQQSKPCSRSTKIGSARRVRMSRLS